MKKSGKASMVEIYGSSFPIGATLTGPGVNFSLFSRNCSSVSLLFFDKISDIEPSRIIDLDPFRNRTYHYWHIFVPGINKGQLYGYRISGPDGKGHSFDPGKVLLDPYSKAVAVPESYDRQLHCKPGRVNSPSMKSVVCDLSEYDWNDDKHPRHSFARTVIYEMHVGGFTKNPNSGVDLPKRGTYSGLIEKIPYLVDLGITAVELLPVFQYDAMDAPNGINYWGYSPVSFFAPHQGYSTSKVPLIVLDEFRDLVKALHKADLEVILDVVFNHTAEGGETGPEFCLKGIDNSIYYILEDNKKKYSDYSGTGNTLNANQPVVRRMIVDSLHFWVKDMHVDGFRFDLASILSRDENGIPLKNPPVLWDIESDPQLAGTKLIAEAWDAAGLYQVGSFIGDNWREWNGMFRDDVRSFMKGSEGYISKFASRMLGSPDVYGHKNREAEQSINFVSCHDGFTLNDLVSYNSKHNEANGEQNRDGANENFSWNCGVEGQTGDTQTNSLRNRQIKNFLALTLLSVGAPMILMGDEVRRSQNGNNNAYCHDNDLTWFDWTLVKKHADIHRFTKQLIKQRLLRDTTKEEFGMSLVQLLDRDLITWHGVKLFKPDWSYNSHSMAFTVRSLSGNLFIHFMINAFSESLEFELPAKIENRKCSWRRWIDTALESPDDISDTIKNVEICDGLYKLFPYSVVVLTDFNEAL
jgi:isoamylase